MHFSKLARKYPVYYRFFEILPGAIVWLIILLVFFGSIFYPSETLILSSAYWAFWIFIGYKLLIGGFFAYRKVKFNKSIDWLKRLKRLPTRVKDLQRAEEKFNKKYFSKVNPHRVFIFIYQILGFLLNNRIFDKDLREIRLLREDNRLFRADWGEVIHVVILANYKEQMDILDPSLDSIVSANYPKDKIIVVLAGEYAASDVFEENKRQVKSKYSGKFKDLLFTLHRLEGDEVAGKGSNLHSSAQQIKVYLDDNHIDYKKVIVSAFDADTRVSENYFGRLTYEYLKYENPHNMSFQPLTFYFNNIWQSPFFSRVIAYGTSLWHLHESYFHPELLFTYSGHASTFESLVKNNYWSTDCVNEDSKQFFRGIVNFDGNYSVKPLFYPIYMDAVLSGSILKNLKNQYKQIQRWAYGAEHIPYLFTTALKEKPVLWKKHGFMMIRYLITNISWASSPVIITLGTIIPSFFIASSPTLGGHNAHYVLSGIYTLGALNIALSALFTYSMTPKSGINFIRGLLLTVIHWFMYPYTLFVLGGIPALDAMTRLMTRNYLQFWSTRKISRT